eukprot:snap_masked-scaffold_15-processed-gene-10.20-mRNA-1 protein AED:0.11 eAED:0.11 QI:0/0/0/0.5/1/1/2/0/331
MDNRLLVSELRLQVSPSVAIYDFGVKISYWKREYSWKSKNLYALRILPKVKQSATFKRNQEESYSAEMTKDIIEVKNLSFSYKTLGKTPNSEQVLHNISFTLPKNSRCLLIGENGAGKTSLLRILAGKHKLDAKSEVNVLGRPAFFHTCGQTGVNYLGQNWVRSIAFAGHGVPYQADICVKDLSKSVQHDEKYQERRKKLYEVLEINPEWRMHKVSDGQRRRVQIMLALLKPCEALFLDEITVDLDVLARKRFMNFLKDDVKSNSGTVIYATHIFDGLDDFPTHLLLLHKGKVVQCIEYEKVKKDNVSLYKFVVEFLEQMANSQPPYQVSF